MADHVESTMILDDADRLMNLEETAKRLRTSRKIVMELIKVGFLGAIQFGKECRVPKSCLNKFIGESIGTNILERLETVGRLSRVSGGDPYVRQHRPQIVKSFLRERGDIQVNML